MVKFLMMVLVVTGVLVMLVGFAGCDLLDPSAPDEIEPESEFDEVLVASALWQRYQDSRTSKYADDEFKDRWAKILVDGVRTVEDDNGDMVRAGIDAVAGKLLVVRTPGQIDTMEFEFRFREDTVYYERGDNQHVVLCNIKGTDIVRTKLRFVHCRASSADD